MFFKTYEKCWNWLEAHEDWEGFDYHDNWNSSSFKNFHKELLYWTVYDANEAFYRDKRDIIGVWFFIAGLPHRYAELAFERLSYHTQSKHMKIFDFICDTYDKKLYVAQKKVFNLLGWNIL